MFGRDEKVSAIRLTAAQYLILAIFLVLAYGLWRLQVMQSDYYSLAAEKNRIRSAAMTAATGRGFCRGFPASALRRGLGAPPQYHHRP